MTDTKPDCPLENIFEVSDQKTIERLIKIGTALTVERDLKELLKVIVEEVRFVVAADKASLFRIDPKKNELIFYITSDADLSERRLPIKRNSIAGYVAMTGETLRIADVYELGEDTPFRFNKEIDRETGYRTKSVLTLPMINHKNERIGVIQLMNKTVRGEVVPFDAEDESLLNALASQAAVSIENAELYNEIEELFESFVNTLASAIDARDPATRGHSRRVAAYTEAIAKAINRFSETETKELRIAAWLHDLGKIGVPENILKKVHRLTDSQILAICERFQKIKALRKTQIVDEMISQSAGMDASAFGEALRRRLESKQEEMTAIDGYLELIEDKNRSEFVDDKDRARLEEIAAKTYIDEKGETRHFLEPGELELISIRAGNLTAQEREGMNKHVIHTARILSKIRFSKELRNVPEIASKHHEKLNGKGYPDGLQGEAIPLQARIISVADIYDALTAQDRPYRKPMSQSKALDILEDMVQKDELDREVFVTFIKNRIYSLQGTLRDEEFSL